MIYTVDRLEEQFAVLEDENGGIRKTPLVNVPEGIREGDKLEWSEGSWRLREDLKDSAVKRNAGLLEKLKAKKRQN